VINVIEWLPTLLGRTTHNREVAVSVPPQL